MNIYGSLMDIYDEKNKDVCDEKQIFMTKKTKDIYVETLLHAPAQPRKGLFMDIQKNNLWTFMAHWWTFMTKKTKDIYVEKSIYIYDEKHKNIYNEKTQTKKAICSYNK